MRFVVLIFLFTLGAYAQHSSQPEKEATNDLRSGLVMFKLEDVTSSKIYWLERTPNLDYFLRMKVGDSEKIIKVDSRDATKLDRDFSSRFLKTQYEIDSAPGDCKVALRLTMRGEGQDLCTKDDKKTQEFAPVLKEVTTRF